MNIIISNSKGIPIYEQITKQLIEQIISDVLKEDEMLPSIRNLAKDLKISVITTKRAYTELENAGYIYTLPGKGSFVAKKNKKLIREKYLREIESHIAEIKRISKTCGLNRENILEMIDQEEWDECHRD